VSLVIWGAGAIGGTIGAYVARAGIDVTLVDVVREHVDTMNREGLHIEGPVETFTVPVRAVTPDELEGTFDTVLLCTKAQHTRDATTRIAPHLAPSGHVVSVQNGLNEWIIAEIVGQERTVGAFVNFGADYLAPGRIHFGGRGAVVIGELDGATRPRIIDLFHVLHSFDPAARITDNIWGYLWGKMGYGAMLFASALTNESIADVLAARHVRPILDALALEVLQVASAEGVVPLGFNGFVPSAFLLETASERRTASYDAMERHNRGSAKTHSGVWRDLAVRKRRTEVDAQYGPIVERAQLHGIDVPHLTRMIDLIHAVEEGRAQQAWATLEAIGTDAPGA